MAEADGAIRTFNCDLLNPDACDSDDHTQGRIRIIHAAQSRDNAYLWTDNTGYKRRFSAHGKLLQIEAPTGEFVSLQYDTRDMLIQVTDPQGRSLRLHYLDRHIAQAGDRFQGVQSIDSPVGRFAYAYGSTLPHGATGDTSRTLANLVRVDLPSQARLYHYENALRPTYLTGISVVSEAAAETAQSPSQPQPVIQRYATFGYDIDGKAVLSTHANGVDKVTLDFSTGGQTRLINSLGQQTVYRYTILAGQYRLLEVRGAGCALCSESNVRYGYDSLGRETEVTKLSVQGEPLQTIKTTLDYYGRPVTIGRIAYIHGKAQALQQQVRYEYGEGTALAPTLIARPSVVPGQEAVTQISYNEAGQVGKVTESGWAPAIANVSKATLLTRTNRYQYKRISGRSLLVEIDGPVANLAQSGSVGSGITRLTWDSSGNHLIALTAPGNFTSRFTYDNIGRLASVVNDAGEMTQWTHDLRGHVTGLTQDGITRTTRYDAFDNEVESGYERAGVHHALTLSGVDGAGRTI